MKNIYIVLSDTGSIFTRLIKRHTKKPYNHASISLRADLKVMYSFGRRHPANPLIGGFVQEGIDCGTFAHFPQTQVLVLEIPVSQDSFLKIEKLLEKYLENKQDYHYNMMGVLGAYFQRPVEQRNHHFCSSFVAETLQQGAVVDFEKSIHLIRPDELVENLDYRVVYEGLLRNYHYRKEVIL